ncbi:MAG: RES family NAD+ phosphorylase [Proteobacteria bacterium]|nr:RES family NAD+ phosphorylase [Pseudomonadota bacterium]
MDYKVSEDSVGDWLRNIVSLRKSIDLFADLVTDPADTRILIEHELATKPIRAPVPIISRPFEEAGFYDPLRAAIEWPFEHPCRTRYSDGSFGVWYGARTLETSVRETVHHFRRDTLASEIAASSRAPIYQERRVHRVRCSAMLVDLRALCAEEPRLLDPDDYAYCQALGAQLFAAALPGVQSVSARDAGGEIVGVFRQETLSDPRDVCYLTYILDPGTGRVEIEREPGRVAWRSPS